MKGALVVLALSLAGATGVDQDLARLLQTPRGSVSTLKGTIRGPGGEVLTDEPVALATVSGSVLYRAKTDPGGGYFFDNIRPGLYAVILEHPAHRVELGRVQIAAGYELVRDFTKGVVISGTVLDEAGAPVGGVTVCLFRAAGAAAARFSPVASALTNARGLFIAGERLNLASGTFTAAVMPAAPVTRFPPIEMITSPGFSPATCAGLPGTTSAIVVPWTWTPSNAVAPMCTRADAFPLTIWFVTLVAVAIGMAKARRANGDAAVSIPTTRPALSSSGPPESPGRSAAFVSIRPASRYRSPLSL